MSFVLKYMLVARYGWRWAIVRVSDREIIQHRRLHIKAAADLRAMESSEEVERKPLSQADIDARPLNCEPQGTVRLLLWRAFHQTG